MRPARYLPSNLPSNPTWRKSNPSDSPILILALTSDTATKPAMYDAASSILAQKISQVYGVGQVQVYGSALPAVRVELNPGCGQQIQHRHRSDRRHVLPNANANQPKGEIAGPRNAWQLSTTDQLFKAKQYKPLVVAYANGAQVRVSDLGDVIDCDRKHSQRRRMEWQAFHLAAWSCASPTPTSSTPPTM